MRSLPEIQKAMAAHKEARPEPPGGWVSRLDSKDYTAYMKRLDAWRDGLSHLEMELAIAERARVVVFITPPVPAPPPEIEAPRERRKPTPPSPKEVQVLLSDMERREKVLTATYRVGDRDAYMQIRNLRSGINMRRERLGFPCIQFKPLPRAQTGRRPHSSQRISA